jgi:hypothetical protein
MKIEIAAGPRDANKVKGDLLEKLAKELLKSQNYQLKEQVRRTGAEFDLLATNRVNGRTIYVECKAERSNLSSNVIFNLKGKTDFHKYSEGWLISTGPLTKDAWGTVLEWEQRPQIERQTLSFYTPERVLDALVGARLLTIPDHSSHVDLHAPGESEVAWTLAITEFGRFWLAPILHSGLPVGVRILDAKSCVSISDSQLLTRLAELDTSFHGLDFFADQNGRDAKLRQTPKSSLVVEILESESWRDYRPSRPQDFVGRRQEQDRIFELFDAVATGTTNLRAFAITGDTGMGKSSLIAKIRARSRNVRNRKRIFVFAVDCRAAEEANYVSAAMLRGLKEAARHGFGDLDPDEIQIDDTSDPLASKSIMKFIETLSERSAICVVFDQFEELYARPELFDVFNEAKKFIYSATNAQSKIMFGFAWRSDATIPLDHPAYHFWHQLSGHRCEISLGPLEPSEVGKAITIFEKEVSGKLRPDVRQQVLENSQGYPWLLKEICINLQEQIEKGEVTPEAIETLDVKDLFEAKVRSLQPGEVSCLKHVAKTSPAEWTEVLDLYGQRTIQSLQEKKFLMRSGDRVVVYWDVFRDFLNSGSPPPVPISYLPSVSMSSVISLGCALKKTSGLSHAQLAEIVSLSEGTIGNVVRDLRMFGVATGSWAEPVLSATLDEGSPEAIARQIRNVFRRHATCIDLLKAGSTKPVSNPEFLQILSKSPSVNKQNAASIKQIGNRFSSWLSAAGFMKGNGSGWHCVDFGSIDLSFASRRRRDWRIFNGSAPPHRALEVLEKVKESRVLTAQDANQPGYEKALNVLSRFELVVQFENSSWKAVAEALNPNGRDAKTLLLEAAKEQDSIQSAVKFLAKNTEADGVQLATYLASEFDESWADGSLKRTGNALKRWADWLLDCERSGRVVEPAEGVRGAKPLNTPEMMHRIRTLHNSGKSIKLIGAEVGHSGASVQRWLSADKSAGQTGDPE